MAFNWQIEKTLNFFRRQDYCGQGQSLSYINCYYWPDQRQRRVSCKSFHLIAISVTWSQCRQLVISLTDPYHHLRSTAQRWLSMKSIPTPSVRPIYLRAKFNFYNSPRLKNSFFRAKSEKWRSSVGWSTSTRRGNSRSHTRLGLAKFKHHHSCQSPNYRGIFLITCGIEPGTGRLSKVVVPFDWRLAK